MPAPRVLIAGLRGGGGKTLVSLGVTAAWRRQGYSVAPYKKGPDYIDAAWLSAAAATPCRNLDLFFMSPQVVLRSFSGSFGQADVAVIEGNRGLYDGMDAEGSTSTAELAKLLSCPVVLTVDCTKATRTIAALVLGCQQLDPQVLIRGVILNRAAGPRHQSVLREAIEQVCGLPVLGAIPRLREELLPERHLGLVPPQEHGERTAAVEWAADVAERYLDLDVLWNVAQAAPDLDLASPADLALEGDSGGPGQDNAAREAPPPELRGEAHDAQDAEQSETVRIGVFRDEAFQFYYPENLEALAREGAEVFEISPLRDAELPEVDALYIGGGFPETLAEGLAGNESFRDSLRRSIEEGLPVYAECGGAVYLGEKLLYEGKEFPMTGVFPVVFAFQEKPQGHGYTVLETVRNNPFSAVGESLKGHEFHYTYMQADFPEDLEFAFRVRRGHGFDGESDGLCTRNVLASYTHVHALGAEGWAPALVRAALDHRARS